MTCTLSRLYANHNRDQAITVRSYMFLLLCRFFIVVALFVLDVVVVVVVESEAVSCAVIEKYV